MSLPRGAMFCPHCGKRVTPKKWLHEWGMRSAHQGSESHEFSECPHCRWQFSVSRPTDVWGNVERLYPRKKKKRLLRGRRRGRRRKK